MNLTIYKFEVRVNDSVEIPMPKGAQVISVGNQRNGHICFWAIVDSDWPQTELRRFKIRGTGHTITGDPGKFVGTVMDELFVWHVFEG